MEANFEREGSTFAEGVKRRKFHLRHRENRRQSAKKTIFSESLLQVLNFWVH
jgi:hypothetical protein